MDKFYQEQGKEIRIVSYNVENLFDTIDNPLKNDDDFLPNSRRHWDSKHYYRKLKQIAQVIQRAGGYYEYPALVALVEVENETVMTDLINRRSLRNAHYQYLISHSPDRRGIDVALIYRPELFKIIKHRELIVNFPNNPNKKSRNILHVLGQFNNQEKLNLFICHAPSRREGVRQTKAYRQEVMKQIRLACQEIYHNNKEEHIIIMGDFNASVKEVNEPNALASSMLKPKDKQKLSDHELQLLNICSQINKKISKGSYCYKGHWEQLDQFIISQSLLKSKKLNYIDRSVYNYNPSYLANKRVKSGTRFLMPWRTYAGSTYLGGYSDHYPIVMKLQLSE